MNTKLLRSKLLSLAISGRLVPQDPADEPASALLHRINPKFTPQPTDEPLPPGWTACKMGEVANYINGRAFKPEEWKTEGLPIVRIQNLTDQTTPFNYSPCIYEDKYLIKDGDLLFAWSATLDSFIWDRGDAWLNQHIFKVEPFAFMDKYYLYYLLKAMILNIYAKTHGSGMVHITRKLFEDLSVLVPPLAEQERIVKEVERWFACIEQLERSREALGKAARQTKRTLLSLAIAGRLVPQDPSDEPASELLKRINPKFTPQPTDSPLPPGWTACTMSMLCELTDGVKMKGKEMINLDAKYLRGQNEGKTLKEGRTIPANSLVILVDGENSGEVFRTPIEGYQGSTFKRLVINDNMYEPFVLQVINSHRKRLRENKVGSAIPHLNKKLFRELTILVPPLAEQERIVRKVEELFAVLDALH